MTPKARIALKVSEKRSRINELLTIEEPSDEQRGEMARLTTELQNLEIEYRASIVADENTETRTEGSPEDRELRSLRDQTRVGNYVAAALELRGLDGAEREFNQALGLTAPGAFPLELLVPEVRQDGPDLEQRATTNVDSQVNQTRWLDRLFADSMAMRLGITFESVSPGVASYPVTTAGASAAQRGRTEAAADGAWTVGVTELKPTRNAVRAVFSEEDAMRLPTLEQALRRDLNMALVEGVDRVVFVGDTGANENSADIAGLTTLGITEKTLTQANKVKGDKTLETFTDFVDGKHAAGLGDLNVVATVGAYRLWASTIHNSATDNQTIAQFLMAAGLSYGVRGDVETATSNGKFGAFIGLTRGIAGAGVAAVWNSGMLIRDPYSNAAKGEVALTLSYFWNFGLPRTSNFARLKFVS